jgi:hypothetical protein
MGAHTDAGWQQITNLTDEAPSASFDAPPFGEISLSVKEILG